MARRSGCLVCPQVWAPAMLAGGLHELVWVWVWGQLCVSSRGGGPTRTGGPREERLWHYGGKLCMSAPRRGPHLRRVVTPGAALGARGPGPVGVSATCLWRALQSPGLLPWPVRGVWAAGWGVGAPDGCVPPDGLCLAWMECTFISLSLPPGQLVSDPREMAALPRPRRPASAHLQPSLRAPLLALLKPLVYASARLQLCAPSYLL